MRTVKDAFFDVLRDLEMTRIFSNPGSTEVPLLVDLPADLEFVLALHEGSVVGMATGWAIGSAKPAMALLHTTAGLGNAVGALATARENRAPLVVVVGQQDRRHLVTEPFLTGQLEGIAGSYPVWVGSPARAADVPSVIARAHREALLRRGPAVVIVPMNDWSEPAEDSDRLAAPRVLVQTQGVDEESSRQVADEIAAADRPVVVVGAGADDTATWTALLELASRLNCPVWQEPFGARAGFPQNAAHFAGHLPAGRSGVRAALAGHDLVLIVGAPSLRQYGYEGGPLFDARARVVLISDDPSEAAHSTADVAVVTSLPAYCARLADLAAVRTSPAPTGPPRPPAVQPIAEGMVAGHVFAALGERVGADTILVEESPSTRLQLQQHVPARSPLGFLSAAMGGLGFAMPAAIGLKMSQPERPVVAVVGDGSSLYGIQSLWSAQHYGTGVLFVVLSNGGYAIMNHLATTAGGKPPWPDFEDVQVGALARALGCPSARVTSYEELCARLDDLAPRLAEMDQPFLLDVVVRVPA